MRDLVKVWRGPVCRIPWVDAMPGRRHPGALDDGTPECSCDECGGMEMLPVGQVPLGELVAWLEQWTAGQQ